MEQKEKLLDAENEYLSKLSSIMKKVDQLSTKFNKSKYDLFGRIDLIYAYQAMQFQPDLENAKDIVELVDCFIKHKMMFQLYNDFMKIESFIFWMKMEYTEEFEPVRDIVCTNTSSPETILTERLKQYQTFLEDIESSNENARCKPAKEIISKILMNRNSRREVTLNELVLREMKYVHLLFETLQNFNQTIEENNIHENKEVIYGKLPEIYAAHKIFWSRLEECRYDLDIIDIMHCFLQSEKMFQLYVEHCSTINKIVYEKFTSKYRYLDLNMISERLFKYGQLLDEFKKHFKEAIEHINKVEMMLKTVITELNDITDIRNIVDENINIEHLGKLEIRGSLKVNGPNLRWNQICNVFLFWNALIFTTTTTKDGKVYHNYVHHITTTYMFVTDYNLKRIKIKNKKYIMKEEEYTLELGPIDEETKCLKDWNMKLMSCQGKGIYNINFC